MGGGPHALDFFLKKENYATFFKSYARFPGTIHHTGARQRLLEAVVVVEKMRGSAHLLVGRVGGQRLLGKLLAEGEMMVRVGAACDDTGSDIEPLQSSAVVRLHADNAGVHHGRDEGGVFGRAALLDPEPAAVEPLGALLLILVLLEAQARGVRALVRQHARARVGLRRELAHAAPGAAVAVAAAVAARARHARANDRARRAAAQRRERRERVSIVGEVGGSRMAVNNTFKYTVHKRTKIPVSPLS